MSCAVPPLHICLLSGKGQLCFYADEFQGAKDYSTVRNLPEFNSVRNRVGQVSLAVSARN